MLAKIRCDHTYSTSADIIRLLALTGCRRSEIIGLRWDEVDFDGSCLRLAESKEGRSEEHTSELQSLMRISYAVFCLKKKTRNLERTQAHKTDTSCVTRWRDTQQA